MKTREDCSAYGNHLNENADHFAWDCPTLGVPAENMCRRREQERARQDEPISRYDEEHEAAAMWGLAENLALSVEERLACALKALAYYGREITS